MNHHLRSSRLPPTGFSLIEMLVALALNMLIMISASSLVLMHLAEQKRLHAETRLHQTLRHSVDLIARDLRRAGYWGAAGDEPGRANPYGGLFPVDQNPAGLSSQIGYSYSRDTKEDSLASNQERFGFRLHATSSQRSADIRLSGGSLALASNDNWQALTDPAAVHITRLDMTPTVQVVSLIAQCRIQSCASSDTPCPPRLLRRGVQIDIDGVDAKDPSVRRSLSAYTLLRNDEVLGRCPS
jgi:type IV pilus assembly protein PilW